MNSQPIKSNKLMYSGKRKNTFCDTVSEVSKFKLPSSCTTTRVGRKRKTAVAPNKIMNKSSDSRSKKTAINNKICLTYFGDLIHQLTLII